MLIHADNFTKDNLKIFVRAHEQRPKRTEFTMMMKPVDLKNAVLYKLEKIKL